MCLGSGSGVLESLRLLFCFAREVKQTERGNDRVESRECGEGSPAFAPGDHASGTVVINALG